MKHFSMKLNEFDGNTKSILDWYCFRKYNGAALFWDGGITQGLPIKYIPWACPTDDQNKISTSLWSIGREGYPHRVLAPQCWWKHLPRGVPVQGELWNDDKLSFVVSLLKHKTITPLIREQWMSCKFIAYMIRPYDLLTDIEYSISESNNFKKNIVKCKPKDIAFEKMCGIFSNTYLNNKHPGFIFKDIFNMGNWIRSKKSEYTYEMMMEKAKAEKWEGLVFINPKATYVQGIQSNVLKWKQEYDHPCRVIRHVLGKTGKNLGKIGSIEVELIWGDRVETIFGGEPHHVGKKVVFCVSGGLSDEDREPLNTICKYPVNSIIEIQFNGVTHLGTPIHSKIMKEK